jgi:hypothetical protein
VHIDWATLAKVAVAAAGAALTIVLLISFAVVSLSRPTQPADSPDGSQATVTHTRVGTAIAALCVLAAGLIVGYGLYLIIVE